MEALRTRLVITYSGVDISLDIKTLEMKPTTYYPWASDDGVTEDINQDGYSGTVPNKTEPDNSVRGYKLEAL